MEKLPQRNSKGKIYACWRDDVTPPGFKRRILAGKNFHEQISEWLEWQRIFPGDLVRFGIHGSVFSTKANPMPLSYWVRYPDGDPEYLPVLKRHYNVSHCHDVYVGEYGTFLGFEYISERKLLESPDHFLVLIHNTIILARASEIFPIDLNMDD